jgi:hypothetical protein
MQKFTDVLNVGEQSLATDSSESPLLVSVLAQRCEQVRNSSDRKGPNPLLLPTQQRRLIFALNVIDLADINITKDTNRNRSCRTKVCRTQQTLQKKSPVKSGRRIEHRVGTTCHCRNAGRS